MMRNTLAHIFFRNVLLLHKKTTLNNSADGESSEQQVQFGALGSFGLYPPDVKQNLHMFIDV